MSFVVVPASYVYLLRDGGQGTEVLLQLRRGTTYMDGHWAAAAAGHVERGETAFAAAQREATEELGITDVDLTFEFTMQRTQGGEPIDERVDFFFTARAWVGDPRIVEPDKAGELRWCALAELPSPMVPHEAYALGHLGTDQRYLSHGFNNWRSAMNEEDLDPMPEPVIEEKEPNPGGADAMPEATDDEGLARDLDPSANPAVDEDMPEELSEPDSEKTQAPDGDEDKPEPPA